MVPCNYEVTDVGNLAFGSADCRGLVGVASDLHLSFYSISGDV